MYLNESKVATLSQAGVLADEFVLTHKTSFTQPRTETQKVTPSRERDPRPSVVLVSKGKEERQCFYCHRPGHLIAECRKLKQRQAQTLSPSEPKLWV